MNLLDKFWKIIPVIVIGFLFACEDPNDIGDALNSANNDLEVLFTEIILPAGNVFIDSVRTDNGSSILLGKYADPLFGETTAKAFTQLDTRNALFEDRVSDVNDFIIDSVFLRLAVSGYHSDDSTQTHGFKVYTLADTLFSTAFYLSHSLTSKNDVVIGEINDYVYDSEENQIQIPLTNDFATQLLIDLEEVNSSLIDFTRFRNVFKGVVIEPMEGNSGIFEIDHLSGNSKLEIYYKIKKETDQDTISTLYEFFLGSSSASYSNLITDRTNTTFAINPNVDEVVSSFTTGDENLYLQPATGIHPKFSLKPYHDFLASIDNIIINRADFEMTLSDSNSDFKYIDKPLDLRYFFHAGGSNINVSGLLSNSFDNTIILTNISYLGSGLDHLKSFYSENDNSYSADATLFSQFVESGDINVDSLIVIPTNVSSMDRVLFDANVVKMKIYYTVPK